MPSSETRLLTISLRISPPMAAAGLVPGLPSIGRPARPSKGIAATACCRYEARLPLTVLATRALEPPSPHPPARKKLPARRARRGHRLGPYPLALAHPTPR